MIPAPLRVAAILVLGIATAGCTSSASDRMTAGAPGLAQASLADTATAYAPNAAGPTAQVEKPYFISFRSRNALSYGHSFVVFGQLTENGNVPYDANGVLIPSMTEIAGLHPASTSNIPYTAGHLIPVPSETGPSDGDDELAYMTAEYRIPLTAAQYRDVVAYIREKQANSPVWHAVLYNCSHFIGDIAEHLGLETPSSLLFPENYIHELEAMNS